MTSQSISAFLENNHLGINAFSIFALIFATALTIVIHYRQEKKSNSVTLEKIKNAKKEIVDIVEIYIINKIIFSEKIIFNLIKGTERFHNIKINNDFDSISILQDIDYRLQTSKHLSISQKFEYSTTIADLIDNIKNQDRDYNTNNISKNTNDILEELNQYITINNEVKYNKAISLLIYNLKKENNEIIFNNKKPKILISISTSIVLTSILSMIISIFIKSNPDTHKSIYDSMLNLDNFLADNILYILIILAILFIFVLFFKHKIISKNSD